MTGQSAEIVSGELLFPFGPMMTSQRYRQLPLIRNFLIIKFRVKMALFSEKFPLTRFRELFISNNAVFSNFPSIFVNLKPYIEVDNTQQRRRMMR